MLPAVVIILPFVLMFRVVGLIDTRQGMILAYTVFNLPFAVWIFRDFFRRPADRPGRKRVDRRRIAPPGVPRLIVLPLAAPGLVATFLFCMMFSWNDYLFA